MKAHTLKNIDDTYLCHLESQPDMTCFHFSKIETPNDTKQ